MNQEKARRIKEREHRRLVGVKMIGDLDAIAGVVKITLVNLEGAVVDQGIGSGQARRVVAEAGGVLGDEPKYNAQEACCQNQNGSVSLHHR